MLSNNKKTFLVAVIGLIAGCASAWAQAETSISESMVGGDRIEKNNATSVGNSLHGLLPGLTVVQTTGEPGNDFDISNLYFRGRNTFAKGQKMLVFIDGFESTLDFITTEEIESITLLKDAAALAIYGGRAANGVLVVRTKKGMISAPKVQLSVQIGIQNALTKPKSVDSYTYATLYNQALQNDGLSPLYSQSDLSLYQNGNSPYTHPNVKWYNQIMRNSAPLTKADMSFRGGSDIIKYYVMGSFLSNGGLYDGTDSKCKENANAKYQKFNFRTNVDLNLNKHFSASLRAGGMIGDHWAPGGNNTADMLIKSSITTAPNVFPVYNPDGSFGGNATLSNPIGELLNRGFLKENSRALQVAFNLKYDFSSIIKGLYAQAGIGYDNYSVDLSSKTRNYSRYSITPNTDGDFDYTKYGSDEPLTATEGFKTDYSRINLKFEIGYDRAFGLHNIDAKAFFLTDQYKEYGVRHDLKYLNYAAQVNYDYDKRYVLGLTSSYMGSDNFARGKQFGFFPAASAAWVMSNESFMQKIKTIDYLKLMVSYGMIGNDQTSKRFLFNSTYSSSTGYLFGTGSASSSGYGENMIGNTNATWEHNTIFNAGLRAKILKKIGIEFDYFNEIHNGILVMPEGDISGLLGLTYNSIIPLENVGKVKNHGFELSVNYDSKIGKKFNYYVEGGVWYAKNKIIESGEKMQAYDYLYEKGHSTGIPITLIADGLYQESDFDANGNLKAGLPVPQFGSIAAGDIKYVDMNKDGIIDTRDYCSTGYSEVPEWNYSFRLNVEYKEFELDAMFHGVANRDVYINPSQAYSFKGNTNASILATDSWTPENTTASYPRLSTQNFDHNYRTSTFWRKNGNYFRLRSLQLSYNMPKKITKAVKLSKINVYVNATNLFTIDAMDGLCDPEMGTAINYPLTKCYSIGMKVSF